VLREGGREHGEHWRFPHIGAKTVGEIGEAETRQGGRLTAASSKAAARSDVVSWRLVS
jgi:hypothetical protein